MAKDERCLFWLREEIGNRQARERLRVMTLSRRQSEVNGEQGKDKCTYHGCRRPVE